MAILTRFTPASLLLTTALATGCGSGDPVVPGLGSSAGKDGSVGDVPGRADAAAADGATGSAGAASSGSTDDEGANGGEGSRGQGASAHGGCRGGADDGRLMECLDRGVLALKTAEGAFVSWRLYGTDPPDVAFNLYREAGGTTARVCERGPSSGTWCSDAAPPAGSKYFVRSVMAGDEGEPSGSAQLLAQDYLRIPLQPASPDAFVHLAWVGDLDGDGEYDFVVDRISANAPLVDAYTRAGIFLFRLDTGPLGANQNNIEGGATTLSNGHWDGLTVYDFDGDGRAEIAIKTASGFVFGDGTTLKESNDSAQFVSIVSGTTGAELARSPLPPDFEADGPLQCHFGVGYFDGVRASVAVKCKNRADSGAFNRVTATYDFDGKALTERWKYLRPEGSDFHQIRVQDVDGDGKDELCDGGYVIDDDGTLLYNLGEQGVVHGDRFHITDMDPERPGLEGWGIQQDNPNGLETYYYDAKTGEILHRYSAASGPWWRPGTRHDRRPIRRSTRFRVLELQRHVLSRLWATRRGRDGQERPLAELPHAVGRRSRQRVT